MALRLQRVSDDTGQRLAATRRTEDVARPPARVAIGAIEIELRLLDRSQPTIPDADEERTHARPRSGRDQAVIST